MDLRGSVGQKIFGESLASERRRVGWKRLFGSGYFAFHCACWILVIFDREERISVGSIEEIHETLLCGLRDCINVFPVALHRQKHGMRGKVAVPDIVTNSLKVPDSLAGLRIQGKQTIREQVIADAVRAVKVEHWQNRSERKQFRAWDRAPCPPNCWQPRRFSTHLLARFRIRTPRDEESYEMTSEAFRFERRKREYYPEVQEAFPDSGRPRSANPYKRSPGWSSRPIAKRQARGRDSPRKSIRPSVTENRNWFARDRVQGIDEIHHADENSFFFTISPIG